LVKVIKLLNDISGFSKPRARLNLKGYPKPGDITNYNLYHPQRWYKQKKVVQETFYLDCVVNNRINEATNTV
jgi:hypothetical protein